MTMVKMKTDERTNMQIENVTPRFDWPFHPGFDTSKLGGWSTAVRKKPKTGQKRHGHNQPAKPHRNVSHFIMPDWIPQFETETSQTDSTRENNALGCSQQQQRCSERGGPQQYNRAHGHRQPRNRTRHHGRCVGRTGGKAQRTLRRPKTYVVLVRALVVLEPTTLHR